MPDVTVDLRDLQVLVDKLFECTSRAKAGRSVISLQQDAHFQAVQRYMGEVDKAVPQAKFDEELRYRDLFESLKSGTDVGSSLAKFLRHDREAFERKLHKETNRP